MKKTPEHNSKATNERYKTVIVRTESWSVCGWAKPSPLKKRESQSPAGMCLCWRGPAGHEADLRLLQQQRAR